MQKDYKLTENILDATKIDNQSLKVNKQYFRLNNIITNVLADHKKEEENNKQRKIKFAYSSSNDNIIENTDAEDSLRSFRIFKQCY